MDDTAATGAGTTLRLWHRFDATPARVFAAWTRPDALRLWWCPAGWEPAEIEVDLRPGGHYRLAMNRQNGGQFVAVHGRFLEIETARKLVYTWHWEGAFPDMPEARVTVEFHAVAGGTEVALRQDALEMRFCAQHLSGWLGAWDRIARVVVGDIPPTQFADTMLAGGLAI